MSVELRVNGYEIDLMIGGVGLHLTGSQLHDIKTAIDDFYDIRKKLITREATTNDEEVAAAAGGSD